MHIALPSASGRKRAAVVATCREAGIPVKTLPNVNDLINGDNDLVAQLRAVQVEDILGREPVQLDPAAVGAYVRGRTVLVTGAGGSIGSELCRQLVRMEVGRLVLADHAENNLFQIDRELRESTRAEIVPAIADVRDAARMETIFETHQPAVVFHAAAYKHVPLMEQHPVQALRNNALATRTMARLAARHAVDRFVLVSTDKAVYPKTAMGASKALAEWVVEALGQVENETTFVAVRFGNVLGSSGSVVPIFREQIARGGPVTVTDPEMTRYFMTIHEAAQLIVQAGGVGRGGDVFVLDMGDPVRILDLAHDMIRLSGLEPERDIPIVVQRHPAGREAARGSLRGFRGGRAHAPRQAHAGAPLAHLARVAGERARRRRALRQRGRRAGCARAGARDDRQPAPRRQRAARSRCSGLSTWIRGSSRRSAPSWSAGRSPRPPSRSASRSRPSRRPCARSSSASASR